MGLPKTLYSTDYLYFGLNEPNFSLCKVRYKDILKKNFFIYISMIEHLSETYTEKFVDIPTFFEMFLMMRKSSKFSPLFLRHIYI